MVGKALESLYQKQTQTVREFALEVEDILSEFLTDSVVGLGQAQRRALTIDREAKAQEVYSWTVFKSNYAKIKDLETLKEAVDCNNDVNQRLRSGDQTYGKCKLSEPVKDAGCASECQVNQNGLYSETDNMVPRNSPGPGNGIIFYAASQGISDETVFTLK